MFAGATLTFEFPVIALIGPNGGGKTTVLGACGCVYSESVRQTAFRKSRLGDESMDGWWVGYEVVDKAVNARGTVRGELQYANGVWTKAERSGRELVFLNLTRTLPFGDNPRNKVARRLTRTVESGHTVQVTELPAAASDHIRSEGEKVLGKSLKEYQFYDVIHSRQKAARTKTRERIRLPDGRIAWVERPTSGVPKTKSSRQTMSVGNNGGLVFRN